MSASNLIGPGKFIKKKIGLVACPPNLGRDKTKPDSL